MPTVRVPPYDPVEISFFLMDGLGRLYFIDHTGDLLLVDTDVARAVWDG